MLIRELALLLLVHAWVIKAYFFEVKRSLLACCCAGRVEPAAESLSSSLATLVFHRSNHARLLLRMLGRHWRLGRNAFASGEMHLEADPVFAPAAERGAIPQQFKDGVNRNCTLTHCKASVVR